MRRPARIVTLKVIVLVGRIRAGNVKQLDVPPGLPRVAGNAGKQMRQSNPDAVIKDERMTLVPTLVAGVTPDWSRWVVSVWR